jgi:hypothetical protein
VERNLWKGQVFKAGLEGTTVEQGPMKCHKNTRELGCARHAFGESQTSFRARIRGFHDLLRENISSLFMSLD